MNIEKLIIGSALLFVTFNYFQKKKAVPSIFTLNKVPGGYNAKTIPPLGIFISKSQRSNSELLKHELIHWQQYQQKGLISFYSDYLKELNKFGYDQMPMEIEARSNETEFCKRNYTECVRNGFSNTVYSPQFRV